MAWQWHGMEKETTGPNHLDCGTIAVPGTDQADLSIHELYKYTS